MSNELLREIEEGTRAEASAALGAYLNAHFHQDQHSLETWTVVAPLVGLLRSRSAVRAEVVQRIGTLVPNKEFHDVTPETGFWRSDENEGSVLSVNAVKAARAELEGSLDDDDFEVRCAAAWTLSLLRPESEPALRARLAVEKDERVYTSLVLALGGGSGDSDVERVLRATSPLDDQSAAAFSRLLSAAPASWLHFEKGLLSSVAARALGSLGRDEPRSFELLMAARTVTEARVKAGPTPRDWSASKRIDETLEDYAAGRAAWPSWEAFLALEKLLGWLVFGERRWGAPLRRAELDARLTTLLPLLWTELENPPRDTAEGIEAFSKGDSVLDDVVLVNGVSLPVCEHLWALCDTGGGAAFDEPKLTALCRTAIETLSPARSFELATALLRGELPYLKLNCKRVIWRQFLPVATRERVVAFTAQLKQPLTHHEEDLAYLLLNDWLVASAPPPPEFDVVVPALLFGLDVPARPFDRAHLLAWLETFSPERLAALAVNSRVFEDLESFCEPAVLGRVVLEAYLAPTCEWSEPTAYDRLKYVNADQLRAAPLTFERRRVADKVLQEGGLEVALTLTLTQVDDEVECSLKSGTSVQVREVTASSLAPLLPELRVNGRRTVTLAGDVSPEVEYTFFFLLGPLLKPVTIIDRNGVTLKSM